MENESDSFDFSKPKSRLYSQSIHKVFGINEEIADDDSLDENEIDLENKKPLSLEKVSINDLNEEKEVIKSKKTKKTEGQPAAIKTFCRIRPTDSKNDTFKVKETDSGLLLVNIDPITLRKFNGISSFTFSKIFDEKSSQKEVFDETCLTLIQEIIQKRKSGLIFTYGMTNAGKTFTVVGSKESPGILPQSLSFLYEKIESGDNGINKFKVFCNFIEIYNEEVFDLLANDPKNAKFKKKVNIKERDKKFFVQDPTYCEINKLQDFNAALNKGINKKVQCSNNINQNSSRSHTIFRIILKTSLTDEEEITLSIVDLAGSERANRTEAQGKELQEACKINQSLSVLGKCMEALKHNSIFLNKKIVPFRESKLTMLFQEYFSGDQNIIMITNINPRKEDFEETMRALNYSCIAKEIKKAKIVVVPIKKIVKLEENINNLNASSTLDTESGLNLTNNCNFINEENDKVNRIPNNTLKDNFEMNPLKSKNQNDKMSNNELKNFQNDLQGIKEQLNILTSNHSFNKSFQNQNIYSCFPNNINNEYLGFPSTYNPFDVNHSCNKDIRYNSDKTTEEKCKENNNIHDNNNNNSNYFNNFYSSNSMHPAVNFMHQGFPFLFPSSFQPFPFLNLINHNLNNIKNKGQTDESCQDENKGNLNNNIADTFDLNSSFTNLGNFTNNLNDDKNNALNKSNYDINIPPNVNTFNMIFINTKVNDVHLGYKGRTYNRKTDSANIINNKSNTKVDKQSSNQTEGIKNKKNNNEKREKNNVNNNENSVKVNKKKGKKNVKDNEKKIVKISSYKNNFEKIFNLEEINENIRNKIINGENHSEISADSLFI